MKLIKEIIVSFEFEHVHRWPDCNVKGVTYLKYPHRHVFKGRAWKHVHDANREIEFIDFKHKILQFIKEQFGETSTMSCEMMAESILIAFKCDKVEIMEDGENGAVVRRK